MREGKLVSMASVLFGMLFVVVLATDLSGEFVGTYQGYLRRLEPVVIFYVFFQHSSLVNQPRPRPCRLYFSPSCPSSFSSDPISSSHLHLRSAKSS